MNGITYDFQAVGEFIALRTETIGLQARLQPFGNSKTVSLTTALAANLGGDVVAIYGGQKAPLRVNHQPVLMEDDVIKLQHGGEIRKQGNGLVLVSPGKSEIRVLFGSYLDYIVTICAPDQNGVGGLLGGGGPNREDGLSSRNGARIELAGLSRDASHHQLYRVYGDSWRITQSESLFDYEIGQTTQTFMDLRFPYDPDPGATLAEAKRKQADAICRRAGVPEGVALSDCILDVAITDDPAFAENNALVEAIFVRSQKAQFAVGSWKCSGEQNAPAWECLVRDLNVSRVGTSMTLSIETLQSGEKKIETLTCGPITESYDAPCGKKTEGIPFQGGQVIERITLKSGEPWEVRSRSVCATAIEDGQPC